MPVTSRGSSLASRGTRWYGALPSVSHPQLLLQVLPGRLGTVEAETGQFLFLECISFILIHSPRLPHASLFLNNSVL